MKYRLFFEVDANNITDWIQIMPGPGTYVHPRYGTIEITQSALEQFVDNFNNGVYQKHIPIDAEHQTKLSGAFGYYRELKLGDQDRPGIWAKIELTDRGKKLLMQNAFKYFSPEYYEEWTDPATGNTYRNVLIGGAFTTRPFYKEKSLAPLVASELKRSDPVKEDNTSNAANETQAQDTIKQLTERNQQLTEQIKQYAEQTAKLAEQLEQVKSEAKRRLFAETVMGKGGFNDGGAHWFGEVEYHVNMLEYLSKTCGENSDLFNAYIKHQNAVAAAIASSEAVKSVGTSTPEANTDVGVRIDQRAKQYAEQYKIPYAVALERVLMEEPRVYDDYNKSFMNKR